VLAWGADDKLFPPAHAERFAREVPGARLERIERSRTFVMIDQPDRLTEIVAGVAAEVTPRSPAPAR
jgi:pimeloyl-ACP methyl ester carboxylesterase